MPYHVNPGQKTIVLDLEIVVPVAESRTGNIISIGGSLPLVLENDFIFLTGGVGSANRGPWKVEVGPTTTLIVATKIGGSLPEDRSEQPGAQIWHGGEVFLNGPGTIPPNQTEIDFADVLLMLIKQPGEGSGGGGPD